MEPSCDFPACIGGECQYECERYQKWKAEQAEQEDPPMKPTQERS